MQTGQMMKKITDDYRSCEEFFQIALTKPDFKVKVGFVDWFASLERQLEQNLFG